MNSEPIDIPAQIADSLSGAVILPCDIFGCDAELLSGEALPAAGESAWRQAQPQEVFGAQCVAAVDTVHIPDGRTRLTDSVMFQTSAVVLLAAYMTILLRSAGRMRAIIGAIFHNGGADASVIEEYGGANTMRLMGGMMLFGTLLAAAVTVKAADLMIDAETAAAIPPAIRSTAPLLAAAAVVGIILWQLLLHKTAAWVCRDADIERLGDISRLFFTAGALLLFPLSALMLLGSGDISSVWVIISVMGMAFVCILYLKETFMFFTSKKISILYWFLYLCSVIALPMSLIYLIATDLQ